MISKSQINKSIEKRVVLYNISTVTSLVLVVCIAFYDFFKLSKYQHPVESDLYTSELIPEK